MKQKDAEYRKAVALDRQNQLDFLLSTYPFRVASFLFSNHLEHTVYRYKYDNSRVVDAQFLSGADAIIRLEKTIAYLKRKQEMWRECLRIQSLPKKQRRVLQGLQSMAVAV